MVMKIMVKNFLRETSGKRTNTIKSHRSDFLSVKLQNIFQL